MAAIGGLWFQAVGTYWSQQTAKDQLQQSHDDAEQALRSQAARVTFWQVETGRRGGAQVHLLNRSRDPVTGVEVRFEAYGDSGRAGGLYIRDSTLPPCTESTYEEKNLRYVLWEKGATVGEGLSGWQAFTMDFTDSDGTSWHRTPVSLTRIDRIAHPANKSGVGYVGRPTLKHVADCG